MVHELSSLDDSWQTNSWLPPMLWLLNIFWQGTERSKSGKWIPSEVASIQLSARLLLPHEMQLLMKRLSWNILKYQDLFKGIMNPYQGSHVNSPSHFFRVHQQRVSRCSLFSRCVLNSARLQTNGSGAHGDIWLLMAFLKPQARSQKFPWVLQNVFSSAVIHLISHSYTFILSILISHSFSAFSSFIECSAVILSGHSSIQLRAGNVRPWASQKQIRLRPRVDIWHMTSQDVAIDIPWYLEVPVGFSSGSVLFGGTWSRLKHSCL